MNMDEIIKNLEHTIEYFGGCVDEFQRGRKHQATLILEQLRQYNVSGGSEQLICPRCGSNNTYKTDAIHCNRCAVTTEI